MICEILRERVSSGRGRHAPRGVRRAIIAYATRPRCGHQPDPAVIWFLDADLGEKTDLAKQHPEVLAELSAALDQWNGQFGLKKSGNPHADE